ncbi:hypothetical protein, unlikely [Trypanosoma congolense IL3000]|uniref:Uncharacterized protein n=1 Tax=Trypanosoma congolense (strain IL3000) TaxID=1068625 RepID=F9W9T8_TRYCI|nr:hypothetical protein, unlikely [Trypanosoma congolense IL3000]
MLTFLCFPHFPLVLFLVFNVFFLLLARCPLLSVSRWPFDMLYRTSHGHDAKCFGRKQSATFLHFCAFSFSHQVVLSPRCQDFVVFKRSCGRPVVLLLDEFSMIMRAWRLPLPVRRNAHEMAAILRCGILRGECRRM